MSNSWLASRLATVRDLLLAVPLACRAGLASAVARRLGDEVAPSQRRAVEAGVADVLADVVPSTVTPAVLEAVTAGTSPRADLARLRSDALAKRDAVGLQAIDEALRALDTARRPAFVHRLAIDDAIARRETSRREAEAARRAADQCQADSRGALLS